MSRFYGNLKGSRSEATKQGTSTSGLSTAARSWSGSILVWMHENDEGTRGRKDFHEHDRVSISFAPGSTSSGGTTLWVGDLKELEEKVAQGYRFELRRPRTS